jgi:suppressor of tumorigenicity protein 13
MDEAEELVTVGSRVVIEGLEKAAQYNGLIGEVESEQADGRMGVALVFQGKRKVLALQRANLKLTEAAANDEPSAKKTDVASSSSSPAAPAAAAGGGGMFAGIEAQVMADPEVVEMLKQPKFKAAYDDVKANPMKFLTYMGDPELGPFINKIMGKMGLGGMGGGGMGGGMGGGGRGGGGGGGGGSMGGGGAMGGMGPIGF